MRSTALFGAAVLLLWVAAPMPSAWRLRWWFRLAMAWIIVELLFWRQMEGWLAGQSWLWS